MELLLPFKVRRTEKERKVYTSFLYKRSRKAQRVWFISCSNEYIRQAAGKAYAWRYLRFRQRVLNGL